MGKMKREHMVAQKHRQIKESFIDWLAKTGNKAAQNYTAGITADDLEFMMKKVQEDFGKPDSLILDPRTIEYFKKQIDGD